MKKLKPVTYTLTKASEPMVLKEVVAIPGIGQSISVRAAKAHLSALLELVAAGEEVTITSGGEPKARLVSASAAKPRKPFPGAGKHLAQMPRWAGGPTAEEIIREDREGRGW
ncbi:MAG: type II toxin-antitoxin system prevent-host-death family antitoxin [Verrucomicrobiota bacterium]